MERICIEVGEDAIEAPADGDDYDDFLLARHSLLEFSLASTAFHCIAQPILYHNVDSLSAHHPPRYSQLLRTIAAKPSTGLLIKRLHVRYMGFSSMDRHSRSYSPSFGSPAQHAGISALLQSFTIPSGLRGRLLHGLRNDNEDAVVATLLCACASLEILDIPLPFHYEPFVAAVTSDAISSPATDVLHGVNAPRPLAQPLHALRELHDQHDDEEFSTDLSDIGHLLQLPGLQTFRGKMLACVSSLKLPHSKALGLTAVYLKRSLFDATGLKVLLKRCPTLETLSLNFGDVLVGDCDLEFDRIGHCLRQHGKNLKTLDLSVVDLDNIYTPLKPLGSLKTFCASHFSSIL